MAVCKDCVKRVRFKFPASRTYVRRSIARRPIGRRVPVRRVFTRRTLPGRYRMKSRFLPSPRFRARHGYMRYRPRDVNMISVGSSRSMSTPTNSLARSGSMSSFASSRFGRSTASSRSGRSFSPARSLGSHSYDTRGMSIPRRKPRAKSVKPEGFVTPSPKKKTKKKAPLKKYKESVIIPPFRSRSSFAAAASSVGNALLDPLPGENMVVDRTPGDIERAMKASLKET